MEKPTQVACNPSWIIWRERKVSGARRGAEFVGKHKRSKCSFGRPINYETDCFRDKINVKLSDRRNGTVFTSLGEGRNRNQIRIDDEKNSGKRVDKNAALRKLPEHSVKSRHDHDTSQLQKSVQKTGRVTEQTLSCRRESRDSQDNSTRDFPSCSKSKNARLGVRFCTADNTTRRDMEVTHESNQQFPGSPETEITSFQSPLRYPTQLVRVEEGCGRSDCSLKGECNVPRRRWSSCNSRSCECHNIHYIDCETPKSSACSRSCEYCSPYLERRRTQDDVEPICHCCYSRQTDPRKLNSKRKSFRGINKYFSGKYQRLQKRFRSRSSPPCPGRRKWVMDDYDEGNAPDRHDFDENMNRRCSVCNELDCDYNEKNCDSDQWERLLACSCKSKSMLDVDKLSLLVHPAPSPYSTRTQSECHCQRSPNGAHCNGSITYTNSLNVSPAYNPGERYYNPQCDMYWPDSEQYLYCEICAEEYKQYPQCVEDEFGGQLPVSRDIGGQVLEYPYDQDLTFADMKKYGAIPGRHKTEKHKSSFETSPSSSAKFRRRKRRKRKYSSGSGILNSIALCFACTLSKRHGGSSSSGGSGSDDDGDDAEGEMEEGFEEHGEEMSDGGDSDGGDSGSESQDASMNSAELFDDQLNNLDIKDVNNIDGSDGGGDVGSEVTDSLTELGSDESAEEEDSSDDDEDSEDDNDDGDGSGDCISIESIIIFEQE